MVVLVAVSIVVVGAEEEKDEDGEYGGRGTKKKWMQVTREGGG